MNLSRARTVWLIGFIMILTTLWWISCAGEKESSGKETGETALQPNEGRVVEIGSVADFERLIDASNDRLLMFDFHAAWCRPCKIVAPILEEVARENAEKVSVYSIDIDKHRTIARQFGVSSIPFVAFVRGGKGLHAMVGVQQKGAYVRAINRFSKTEQAGDSDAPDGEISEGTRVISISTVASPGKIYVYRGETVELLLEAAPHPYSIHIPEYGISEKGVPGEGLTVAFKAEEIGVYPIFCNGQCPTGDGERYGQIVVMQFEASGDAAFTELTAAEAFELIAESDPIILDVRTPNEFYSGHIENALLIPLHQLEVRLGELSQHRDREILAYCRSGNRSTVAAEILIRNGFKKLYNLRPGIRGWRADGYALSNRG